MKSTFSLRRLATLMISAAVIVAVFNTATILWLTNSLQQNQAKSEVIS